MSQNRKILAHLRNEGSITAIEAIRRYKILRLSARIHDLKDKGIQIETKIHESDSKGAAGNYAEYKYKGERQR